MAKLIDLTGQEFGRLTVVKYVGNGRWLCRCDCGSIKIILGRSLRGGQTKSCGCLQKEKLIKVCTKHGKHNSRLYSIMENMKRRCYSVNDKRYKNYGGRGIKICDEWKNDFMNFYNWAMNNGYKDDLTIDRIDVNGNYEPSNCRWVTIKEQARNTTANKFITYNGLTFCVAEWAEKTGLSQRCINGRLYRGWDIERTLTTQNICYNIVR